LVFVYVLLVSAVLAGCDRGGSGAAALDTKRPKIEQAIAFTLPDLAGRSHTLAEYLQRGPVMLVFYTTWCPYCRKEIPTLKQAYYDYAPKGLQIVAVNAGLADSIENARAYAAQHTLPYPVLYDADAKIAALYQVRAVPLIFLIQQNGHILKADRRVPMQILPQFVASKDAS
jgi:peroxiredoxin